MAVNVSRETRMEGGFIARITIDRAAKLNALDRTTMGEIIEAMSGLADDPALAVERERVFEAFVQGADRVARSDGSAGLGLAISRAIVEAHGGRIWIDDAQVGTSVRFSLPCAS